MTATEDINVDELRRRARRRLVGAIVLALAVAVFVPMLLESDPKPLGEDVSVKIPPVDEGKFVNRLSEKAPPAPVKAAPLKPEPKVEPKPEPPKPPPAVEEAPKVEVAKAEPSRSEPAKVEPPKSEPSKSEQPKSEQPKGEGAGDFAVQVFAFSDDKGANSLVNKLKKAGYPAYTEPLSTSKGTLWRVRIGPYPTRESAASARDRLKGEGYNGIVAAAK